MGLASIALLPTPAHSATADVVKQREWSTGYVGQVTVRNPGPAAITSWRVEFDLPSGTSVTNAWGAALTRSGSRYAFANLRWNGGLAPGGSTSFGFLARGIGDPLDCTVNADPCAGAPPLDVTPPSTPNARLVVSPSWAVVWDPSTDDTGVVGYEVFGRSGAGFTTTNTSFPLSNPPPTDTVYGIRAVDAAGNASPAAVVVVGPFDIVAPTAPTNLRIAAPTQGYLPVGWDASKDDLVVAGYEVYLDDVLVTSVGNTRAYVPYHGYGTYKVGVRAYDVMRRFSPITEVSIAIDPPPGG